MTSNTSPRGQCFGSGVSSGYAYYYAFDNNNNTGWFQTAGSSYIGYKFTSPVSIKRVYAFMLCPTTGTITCSFVLQGSNDGSTWDNLSVSASVTMSTQSAYSSISIDSFNNNKKYLYYRLAITSSMSASPIVRTMQFYA